MGSMTMAQQITSAATSVNMLPRLFSKMPEESDLFQRGSINLDIGGGRFETATDFLHSKGVHNFVWDPFNRDDDHNSRVWEMIVEPGFADTVTLSNVLNVIRNPAHRIHCLEVAVKALRPWGTCFITVYEGDRSGRGKKTSKGFQLNRRTERYVFEVREVFAQVDVAKNKIIVARV
jgi:hypothetical protein